VWSRLASAVSQRGGGALQLVFPDWSYGRLSVAINAVRHAADLAAALAPGAPLVRAEARLTRACP
jgi:hypothetical protein